MTHETDPFDLQDPALEEQLEALVGPPGEWRMRQAFQFDLIRSLGLMPGHRLLDIGCGTLRAGLPLIDYLDPGHYVGVDVDAARLDHARALASRFGLDAKSPRLVQSDNFGLSQLAGHAEFDRIWVFQVVIHLERRLIDPFMAAIAGLLHPGGRAWVTLFGASPTGRFQQFGNWREFALSRAPLPFYTRRAAAAGLDLRHLRPLSSFGVGGKGANTVDLVELTHSSPENRHV